MPLSGKIVITKMKGEQICYTKDSVRFAQKLDSLGATSDSLRHEATASENPHLFHFFVPVGLIQFFISSRPNPQSL